MTTQMQMSYHTGSKTRAHVVDHGSFATVHVNEDPEDSYKQPSLILFFRTAPQARRVADAINGVKPVWMGVKLPNGWDRVVNPEPIEVS